MEPKKTIEEVIEELTGLSERKGTEISAEYRSKEYLPYLDYMSDQIRLTESVICNALLQGTVNRRYLSILRCMRQIVELLVVE